jgi:nitrate reductase NapD
MPVIPALPTPEIETGGEIHIAGIVVHAAPERLVSVQNAINGMPGAEVHAVSAEGKLVVTLEGRRTSEVAGQIDAIHTLPGVYSAALVYQHHEDIESLNDEVSDEAKPPRIY